MHLDQFAGYKFNITFLRNFLAPIYEIHDIKQNPDNEFEILSRWSFSMQFWWLRYLPPIKVRHTAALLASMRIVCCPCSGLLRCGYTATAHDDHILWYQSVTHHT